MLMHLVSVHVGRVTRIVTPFVLAILLGLLPWTSLLAAGSVNQGLQGGWAVDNRGSVDFAHGLASQLALMQAAGAGWVRVNFRLGDCFHDWTSLGCNGKTALQTYDTVVAAAQAHHLVVLGLLSNESWNGTQTDWTANNAENAGGNGDNPYIQSFASHAAAVLAAHFDGTNGPQISHWEIWNEPNAWEAHPGPGVYTGGSFLYPSNFAWLLTWSDRTIKAANPTAVVISGGLYAHETSPSAVYKPTSTVVPSACSSSLSSGASYFCNTYAQGIAHAQWAAGKYPFDEVGQHLYVDQFGPTSSGKITAYLQDLHAAYLAYEGTQSTKPIDLTEVGWSTAHVSAQTQARNLRTAFAVFEQTTYIARAYWFNIQDLPEASLAFGLVGPGGTAKPAFTAYRQAAVP